MRYRRSVRRPGARARGACCRARSARARRAASLCPAGQSLSRRRTATDWPDNARRFAALCRGRGANRDGRCPAFAPDVVHAHDWQAGLAPPICTNRGAAPGHGHHRPQPGLPGTVPGRSVRRRWACRRRPSRSTASSIYGGIGFLKAGPVCSPTASPPCRRPMRRRSARPRAAWALDGLLRAPRRRVDGILNGIDDDGLESGDRPADRRALRRRRPRRGAPPTRRRCRRASASRRAGAPLFGVVSRLTWQKGMDLAARGAAGAARRSGAQLALLGTGDRRSRRLRRARRAAIPAASAAVIGYDEALAHQIQAGADALLVPSRFEPCGLTQLCACATARCRSSRASAGLADTVIDANEAALAAGVATGIQFAPRDGGGAGARHPAHGGALSQTARSGGACSATPWRPTSPGARSAAAVRGAVTGHLQADGRELTVALPSRWASASPRPGVNVAVAAPDADRHRDLPVRRDRHGGRAPARCRGALGAVSMAMSPGWPPGHATACGRMAPGTRRGASLQPGQAAGGPLGDGARPAVPAASRAVRRAAPRPDGRQRAPSAEGGRGGPACRPRGAAAAVRPGPQVIYELHVRGFTMRHPAVPRPCAAPSPASPIRRPSPISSASASPLWN